jgi:hypothetical protein
MHVLRVDEQLVETGKARDFAEREMAVSVEQLFATLEDGRRTAGGCRRFARSSGQA